MFVTARLALGEQTLPAVPATAVRGEGTLRHVFVAEGGRLEDRLVQAGERPGGEVPIVSGLKAGEQVVAELTPEVRDGAAGEVRAPCSGLPASASAVRSSRPC